MRRGCGAAAKSGVTAHWRNVTQTTGVLLVIVVAVWCFGSASAAAAASPSWSGTIDTTSLYSGEEAGTTVETESGVNITLAGTSEDPALSTREALRYIHEPYTFSGFHFLKTEHRANGCVREQLGFNPYEQRAAGGGDAPVAFSVVYAPEEGYLGELKIYGAFPEDRSSFSVMFEETETVACPGEPVGHGGPFDDGELLNECGVHQRVADLGHITGTCVVENEFGKFTTTYDLTLSPSADSDGDGYSDIEELEAGTNPVDGGSHPSEHKPTCAVKGEIGTYPACHPPTCAESGLTGTYPACVPNPTGGGPGGGPGGGGPGGGGPGGGGPGGGGPGGGGGRGGGGPGGGGPPDDGKGPPPPSCGKHSVSLPGGVTVEASCFREPSSGVLTATGQIRVNGLDIVATGGVTLDTRSLKLTTTGTADVYLGSLRVYHGSIAWSMTGHLTLSVPGGLKLKGLALSGTLDLRLVPGGVDGTATASVTGADHHSPVQVSGSLAVELKLTDGLELDSLTLELASKLPFKGLVAGKARLHYADDSGAELWEGTVGIELPSGEEGGEGGGPTITGTLVVSEGHVNEIALAADSINKPLGEIVFLQSLGLKVLVGPPLTATGSIGLSAGPEINGKSAASIDGSLTATLADPFVLEGAGELSLVDEKLAGGGITAYLPGSVLFHGNLAISIASVDLSGYIKGYVEPSRFTATAGVTLGWHGYSATGFALANNNGIAGCGRVPVYSKLIEFGGASLWNGHTSLFHSCGFGELEGKLAARAASTPTLIHVPAGVHQINLLVKGATAPPTVLLGPASSPTSVAPESTGLYQGHPYAALADPEDNETAIAINEPSAGTIEVSPAPGQASLAGVESTVALPTPSPRLRLSNQGHDRYTVSWSARRIPGQRLVFEDTDSRGAHPLASSTASHGHFTFTAANDGTPDHTLNTTVEQEGLIREVVPGPAYHPANPHLARPPASLRRHHRIAILTWRPGHGAVRTEITITTADGQHLYYNEASRTTTLRIASDAAINAGINYIGPAGEHGPARELTLKAETRPRKRQ